jgi:hypothetical protein
MHGKGPNTACAQQIPVPARIDITPGNATGVSPCVTVMTDSINAAYIHGHSAYQWVPTNVSDQLSHGDAVVLKGKTYRFMVGRFQKDNWTSICKV